MVYRGYSWLAVAAGALLGFYARNLLTTLPANYGFGQIWGVFWANVLGAAALGWYSVRLTPGSWQRYLVCTGFLGTFTTYSTLMLFTVNPKLDIAYLLLTLCVGALAASSSMYIAFKIKNRNSEFKSVDASHTLEAKP